MRSRSQSVALMLLATVAACSGSSGGGSGGTAGTSAGGAAGTSTGGTSTGGTSTGGTSTGGTSTGGTSTGGTSTGGTGGLIDGGGGTGATGGSVSGGASGGGGAAGATLTFDFDTGTPTLSTGQGIPLAQSVSGVTINVSSPQGNAFSVQTDSSTQWKLSQFSGHYLMDNNLNKNVMHIAVDTPVTSFAFTFATADFNQTEVPTNVQLTAYSGATSVGTQTTHGTYAGDTMPMGVLSFTSSTAFDAVDISIPYQPLGASDFMVDNIVITTK